jgi:hypothetical protein
VFFVRRGGQIRFPFFSSPVERGTKIRFRFANLRNIHFDRAQLVELFEIAKDF